MKEVFDIGDRISVLKDGKYQGTFPIAEITQDVLFNKMIGRDIQVHEMASPAQKNIVLEARNLSGAGFHHINFSLHQGEILALTGLVGAGRTEIARAIFGVNPIHQGQLFIHGVSVRIRHPRDAILRGIGYLPEERKEDGLFLPMSMTENILAGKIAIQRGMLRSHSNQDAVEGYIRLLHISPGNAEQKAINFSGGNQQKMVLAKWLLLEPGIFIADEPTHGIDVGAKHEIYQLLNKLAAKGAGILLISSELPEALTLAHRILVICRGRLTADLARDKATEEDIMHYASGTKNMFSGV
jgi:ribose transport system ATP-binding protein